MMLTQRLSVLAHDLAKQCHVAPPNKPEERPKFIRRKHPPTTDENSSSKKIKK